jgi:hypothetical protein
MSRTDTVDDRVYYYWSNGTSSGSTRYGMTSRSTGAFSTYYRQLDADSLTLRVPSDSNSPGSGTPFIYRLTTEYTSADTSMFLSNVSDTSEYGSMTLPSSNAVSNTSSLLAFLGKGTASYFCPNFKLGELIITRAKPTASEISQLYSYFRVRWGAL